VNVKVADRYPTVAEVDSGRYGVEVTAGDAASPTPST
jgi:hypothetical protein